MVYYLQTHMHLSYVSKRRFYHTIGWAVLLCALIVGVAATLGRATMNIRGALTDNPDLAIFLLLEEEGVTQSTLLRQQPSQRDYLVQTAEGQKLVLLKKGEKEWYVSRNEQLHENEATAE